MEEKPEVNNIIRSISSQSKISSSKSNELNSISSTDITYKNNFQNIFTKKNKKIYISIITYLEYKDILSLQLINKTFYSLLHSSSLAKLYALNGLINTSENTKKIFINKNNDIKNSNREILFNSKEEKDEKDEKDEKEENINNNEQELFNYINLEPESNNLLKSIIDDIEYIDIKKSIKSHGNKTNSEIEASLLKKNNSSSLNNFIKLKKLFDLKIDEEDNKSADGEYDNNIKEGIFNKKKLMNEKEKYEKRMEENIKYIKYYSRKNYEEIRDKKKRNLNICMGCIMIFVFLIYFLYSKYHESIHSFIKSLLIPKKEN